MKNYYVYILASKKNGVLYSGITNELIKRVYEHKNNLVDGFTKKYFVHRLFYVEGFISIDIVDFKIPACAGMTQYF